MPFRLGESATGVWALSSAGAASGLMVEVEDDLPNELARGARCVSLSSLQGRRSVTQQIREANNNSNGENVMHTLGEFPRHDDTLGKLRRNEELQVLAKRQVRNSKKAF